MISKTMRLPCGPERAFALFTEEAGAWWPSDRRHTGDPASLIRIEASGRFWERAADGREVELGKVRVFEPARRLVLDWFPGTDPEHPTHVEVRFQEEDGGTRVTVEHRAGPFSQDLFETRAAAYERSWALVLGHLERFAGGA